MEGGGRGGGGEGGCGAQAIMHLGHVAGGDMRAGDGAARTVMSMFGDQCVHAHMVVVRGLGFGAQRSPRRRGG